MAWFSDHGKFVTGMGLYELRTRCRVKRGEKVKTGQDVSPEIYIHPEGRTKQVWVDMPVF